MSSYRRKTTFQAIYLLKSETFKSEGFLGDIIIFKYEICWTTFLKSTVEVRTSQFLE
jgi:hypothetical protein